MKELLIEENKFILLLEDKNNTIMCDLLYCQALQYIKKSNLKLKCYRITKEDLEILIKYNFINNVKSYNIPILLFVNNKRVIKELSDFPFTQEVFCF